MLKFFKIALISLMLVITGCGSSVIPGILTDKTKDNVVIMGDSWGWVSETLYHSYSESIDRHDLKTLQVLQLNSNGMTAEGILSDDGVTVTTLYFAATERVKYIVLSIGGNDLLAYWKNGDTTEDKNNVIDKIVEDIVKIVVLLQGLEPDAKIIIQGYDFPNFDYDSAPSIMADISKQLWLNLGEPTATEFNSAMVDFSSKLILSLSVFENVFYSNNLGMMQYSDNNMLLEPGQYPDYYPLYGGNLHVWSPWKYFEHHIGIVDSIHLNKIGYDIVAERLIQTFIVPDYR